MNIHLLDHIDDLPAYVATLSVNEKRAVLKYLQAVEEYKTYNKLEFFTPEEWQRKAITLGSTEKFRGVIAGNR